MAKGFTGDNESLTDSEKRLIKAAGSKIGKGRDKLGGKDEKKVQPDKGQEGTRTRHALAMAVSKLKRLEGVAIQDIKEKAARKKPKKVEGKGKDATDAAKTRKEKSITERKMGMRRGS